MVSHVIDFLLVQQEPSHGKALDRGKTHFYKENRVGCFDFNFEFVCYKTIMDVLNHFPGFSRYITTPNLTPIQDKRSDESFKEELLCIPHRKVYCLTIIFKTKISFPPSINPFLNVIVLFDLVMNINSWVFVRRQFLQVAIVIHKISLSVLLGFDNHNFWFASVNNHTNGREKNP